MDQLQAIDIALLNIYTKISDSFIWFFGPFSPLSTIIRVFHILLFVLAIFCLFVIAYSVIRIFEIRKKEHAYLHHEIKEYRHKHAHDDEKDYIVSDNQQWVSVLKHLTSPNESDWKFAIMEADNMLDAVMTELGFDVENLGEKLKSADQEKFKYLSLAWEVHIIRNRIAHEGFNFLVSQVEAKRVIAIYEQIFRGYGFI